MYKSIFVNSLKYLVGQTFGGLTFDSLTFELAFKHSVIKSLTLEMALQNRDSGIKSRTKAYRPLFLA